MQNSTTFFHVQSIAHRKKPSFQAFLINEPNDLEFLKTNSIRLHVLCTCFSWSWIWIKLLKLAVFQIFFAFFCKVVFGCLNELCRTDRNKAAELSDDFCSYEWTITAQALENLSFINIHWGMKLALMTSSASMFCGRSHCASECSSHGLPVTATGWAISQAFPTLSLWTSRGEWVDPLVNRSDELQGRLLLPLKFPLECSPTPGLAQFPQSLASVIVFRDDIDEWKFQKSIFH